ncbi:MAG: GTPase Era [Acidimicrobiia bacterium]
MFRSGFVSLVGRPNVGKSTLLNAIIGTKVSIVSPHPQTTRSQIRGVLDSAEAQVVFLDTPGIHKPRTLLGERTNQRAVETLNEVDVVCMLIEANAPIGRGDQFIAELVQKSRTARFLIVNKTDAARPDEVLEHLAQAAVALGDFDEFFPISARTGAGVDALVRAITQRLPEGPRYYPEGTARDQAETTLAAELLREKLLAVAREELPHSISVVCEELEADDVSETLRLRAVIRVERDSQKGIVIGKGGATLRDAGTAARQELEALLGSPVYLETIVRVDSQWQRRSQSLDRLGF